MKTGIKYYLHQSGDHAEKIIPDAGVNILLPGARLRGTPGKGLTVTRIHVSLGITGYLRPGMEDRIFHDPDRNRGKKHALNGCNTGRPYMKMF